MWSNSGAVATPTSQNAIPGKGARDHFELLESERELAQFGNWLGAMIDQVVGAALCIANGRCVRIDP